MTTQPEAAAEDQREMLNRQALEALKMMRDKYGEYACPACDHADAAIDALRDRLAQPDKPMISDDFPREGLVDD